MLRRCVFVLLLAVLAACQPAPPANPVPTVIPFPTVTPGRVIAGVLPPLSGVPLDGGGLANPATAVALANQPTPTPDYSQCPNAASPLIDELPATDGAIIDELSRFLTAGGTAVALRQHLGETWGILDETGFVRNDADLTGEGSPDVIAAYMAPEQGGSLVILGCANGRYSVLYSEAGGGIPQILNAADMNADGLPEVMYAVERCTDDNACSYQTQVIRWNAEEGRFVRLTSGAIESENLPTVGDIDDDRVAEIAVRLTNTGSGNTGPLRTGVLIYDWNGLVYTLSVNQLDPPLFRIQVIQQADEAFADLNMQEAIPLYETALNNPDLRNWLNGDRELLRDYTLYRLLLAYAFTEDERRLEAYQAAVSAYPDWQTAPVYIQMAVVFWNTLQVSNNLNTACVETLNIAAGRPEAVTQLNSYGESGPTYTLESLCPF